MEHRCGYRRPIAAQVTLRTRGGLAAEGRIENLSCSGALVRTCLPLPVHMYVIVQFAADRERGPRDRTFVPATVIRLLDGGFAIEWIEFAPPAIRNIILPRVEAEDERFVPLQKARAR